MTAGLSVAAVTLVCILTLAVGSIGLRLTRGTSDIYVAGRTVSPRRNASAIAGEYLSAASFLGVAALVYARGFDMLWFPVGYTVGYLVLLVLVAAPLRRSGAYTLPDFAEARLESRTVRLISSVLVVGIGWLYLLPQFQAAGLALRRVTGWPSWAGALVLTVVVGINVASGGMRSLTLSQAMHYWLKLTAIVVPAFVLLLLWLRQGHPAPSAPFPDWASPGGGFASTGHPLYATWSTLLALALGTMGLPHVVVRFYTNPNGRDARRTTVSVIGLLGLFYVIPPVYAVLGRVWLPRLPTRDSSDLLMLDLPHAASPGTLGALLTAIIAAGAFAAFISTSSGLVLSVSTVVHQDLLQPRISRMTSDDASPIASFRMAAVLAAGAPYLLSRLVPPLGLATTVGLAFAVAAATFAPLLVLGVWWRRLSTAGAAAGLLVGGISAAAAVLATLFGGPWRGWPAVLLAQPAAWATPLAAVTMIAVSYATPRLVPPRTVRTLARLHTPESVLGAAHPRAPLPLDR